MRLNATLIVTGIPIIATVFAGAVLSSSVVSADDSVVDEINITVPVSCSLSGVGMNTHNAEINNGQYNSAIGETTLKAICNDNEGFAIYAIGYTDDTAGKNVLADATLGSAHDIVTGTAISGDTSNWAMKLTAITNPTPTYPISIQNSFDSFHNVPTEQTLVAKRTSSTDIGASAEGSSLKTTYQAYVSRTQSAGTYTGQVKYTLVHPHTAPEPVEDNQIGVIYDGNGLFFDQAGTKSTNKVIYENVCEDEYGYIADTPSILHTDNLDSNGNQDGSYYRDYEIFLQGDSNYFEGASQIKVEIYYKINYDTTIWVHSGGFERNFYCEEEGCEGTLSYVLNNYQATIFYDAYGASTPGYDYGIYARLYPVYSEPTAGTTYGLVQENVCSYRPVIGAFASVIGGNDLWYNTELGEENAVAFYADDEYDYDKSIIDFLNDYSESLSGSTITFYASNKYTIIFDANGGSGTMANQEVYQYDYTRINESAFTMPHKDVIKWTTNSDGTGKAIYANLDYDSEDWLWEPLANAGDTIRLYAQWGDCMRGKVCYDDNGANSSTKMSREQTYQSSFTLWASNYKRQNHGFAGWNTKPDYTGTNYGPNETLSIAYDYDDYDKFTRTEGLRLFAKWIPSAGDLQNWSGCDSLGIGDVTALTDTRDNNTYAIAKLADGNCWMIENLRLGGTSSMTLTTSDTQSAGTLPAATNGQLSIINTHSTVSVMNNANSNVYSYGNYYSWAVAINDSTNYSSNVDIINTSICPSGWHLPYYGNQSGGFYHLNSSIGTGVGSDSFRKYPNNFVYSGYYGGSRGTGGSYWSTRSFSNSNASYLDFGIRGKTIDYSGRKTNEFAVRCVMNASN